MRLGAVGTGYLPVPALPRLSPRDPTALRTLLPVLHGAKEVNVRFDGQVKTTYELALWQVEAMPVACDDRKTPALEKSALQSQVRLVADAEKAEREAEASLNSGSAPALNGIQEKADAMWKRLGELRSRAD